MSNDLSGYICIPLRAEVYNEFILRMGESVDNVPEWIENVVLDYLDRTADDGPWGDEYFERRGLDADPILERRKEFGPPEQGYQWQNLLLKNGTAIRMQYRGQYHYATIKHGQLWFQGDSLSPSEFARTVANHTSRNAWRDLELKAPGSNEYILADVVRRKARASA